MAGPNWRSCIGSLLLMIAPTIVFLIWVAWYMGRKIHLSIFIVRWGAAGAVGAAGAARLGVGARPRQLHAVVGCAFQRRSATAMVYEHHLATACAPRPPTATPHLPTPRSCILPAMCVAWLLLTACRDPGVLPRQEPDEEWLSGRKPRTKEVVVNGHPVQVRYNDTCHFYQPPRAHHCSVNDNCIERFDHHCPWVGTTIGKVRR
jgi:hypothetical protein